MISPKWFWTFPVIDNNQCFTAPTVLTLSCYSRWCRVCVRRCSLDFAYGYWNWDWPKELFSKQENGRLPRFDWLPGIQKTPLFKRGKHRCCSRSCHRVIGCQSNTGLNLVCLHNQLASPYKKKGSSILLCQVVISVDWKGILVDENRYSYLNKIRSLSLTWLVSRLKVRATSGNFSVARFLY